MRTLAACVGVTAGYPLSQFVTYCAEHYLSSEHKDVRLEAVKTCSHLLTPSLNVSHLNFNRSESRHKGSNAPSVGSLVVVEERMRPGHCPS